MAVVEGKGQSIVAGVLRLRQAWLETAVGVLWEPDSHCPTTDVENDAEMWISIIQQE